MGQSSVDNVNEEACLANEPVGVYVHLGRHKYGNVVGVMHRDTEVKSKESNMSAGTF